MYILWVKLSYLINIKQKVFFIYILFFAEDGRLKYKVSFEDKGKSLVSGHHIAFDHTPKLEQLYVGARVVIRCQDNKFRFFPGILAELPSRKNRLRWVWLLFCFCMYHLKLIHYSSENPTALVKVSFSVNHILIFQVPCFYWRSYAGLCWFTFTSPCVQTM